MCWIGFKNDRMVSEKDKTVFKAMYKNNDNRYYSPLRGFEYKPNKLYEVESLDIKLVSCAHSSQKITIDRGLHTFDNSVIGSVTKKGKYDVDICGFIFIIGRHILNDITGNLKLVFVKCIIPKGTVYYESCGEVVSEKLIMTEEEVLNVKNIS